MQHPDEGTIHSWLDGALPVEEAGRMESHVAECPECSTAVAEARGFIAASSRILTALDDIPRGVVPVAPARKRDLRVFWRAAAAMLVVAGGSLVVMREGGQDARVDSSAKETPVLSPALSPSAVSVPEVAGASAAGSAPQSDAAVSNQSQSTPPASRTDKVAASPERDLSGRAPLRRGSGSVQGVAGERIAADATVRTGVTVQAPANAVGAQSEVAILKVLGVERTIGGRRTIYEVTPTETVTLTEPESMVLSGVVTGSAASVQEPQIRLRGARSAEPMRAEAAAAPPPVASIADSRRAADSATVSTEAVAMAKTSAAQTQAGAAFVSSANTISWTETATGKTLTLSGSLPVERLQEIRRRIETEREASRKKAP